jgi:hypothetical protein
MPTPSEIVTEAITQSVQSGVSRVTGDEGSFEMHGLDKLLAVRKALMEEEANQATGGIRFSRLISPGTA